MPPTHEERVEEWKYAYNLFHLTSAICLTLFAVLLTYKDARYWAYRKFYQFCASYVEESAEVGDLDTRSERAYRKFLRMIAYAKDVALQSEVAINEALRVGSLEGKMLDGTDGSSTLPATDAWLLARDFVTKAVFEAPTAPGPEAAATAGSSTTIVTSEEQPAHGPTPQATVKANKIEAYQSLVYLIDSAKERFNGPVDPNNRSQMEQLNNFLQSLMKKRDIRIIHRRKLMLAAIKGAVTPDDDDEDHKAYLLSKGLMSARGHPDHDISWRRFKSIFWNVKDVYANPRA